MGWNLAGSFEVVNLVVRILDIQPPHGVSHATCRPRCGAENTRQQIGEAFLRFQAAETAWGVSCLKILNMLYIYPLIASLFYYGGVLGSGVLLVRILGSSSNLRMG
mgnify:CR=1 FL=1